MALCEEERLEELPDIPTFKEQGYPIVAPSLFSLAFPKRTPQPVVDRFAEAQKKAIGKYRKEITEGLRRIEQVTDFRSPQDTLKVYKEQYDMYFKLAQELGWLAR